MEEDLELDLVALKGKATITLAPSASKAASFEIGDSTISKVSDGAGALMYSTMKAKQLDVGLPASPKTPSKLVVEYDFQTHSNFDGWLPKSNVTFLWPYFCGNLFPCKSDPSDGVQFKLSVTATPQNKMAVFPAAIPADAPSYMLAIAVGDYTKTDLGKTTAGTSVSVYSLPGDQAAAMQGTPHLKAAFDFYEKTYGPYTFSKDVGSVDADWGPGAFGGMEHHPYWHIAKDAMNDELTHAHEAAHGWFGDGVRIQCWEDFVLSEGTVSYLSWHALQKQGVDTWVKDFDCNLKYDCDPANMTNTIALPTTCDKIDLLHDPLWSDVPYTKGAFFYHEVAKVIGEDVLDQRIAEFYQAHVGKAAHMQDMIDHLEMKANAADAKAIDDLATKWLKTLACPVDTSKLCP